MWTTLYIFFSNFKYNYFILVKRKVCYKEKKTKSYEFCFGVFVGSFLIYSSRKEYLVYILSKISKNRDREKYKVTIIIKRKPN